jgi:hypothetical protein
VSAERSENFHRITTRLKLDGPIDVTQNNLSEITNADVYGMAVERQDKIKP